MYHQLGGTESTISKNGFTTSHSRRYSDETIGAISQNTATRGVAKLEKPRVTKAQTSTTCMSPGDASNNSLLLKSRRQNLSNQDSQHELLVAQTPTSGKAGALVLPRGIVTLHGKTQSSIQQ